MQRSYLRDEMDEYQEFEDRNQYKNRFTMWKWVMGLIIVFVIIVIIVYLLSRQCSYYAQRRRRNCSSNNVANGYNGYQQNKDVNLNSKNDQKETNIENSKENEFFIPKFNAVNDDDELQSIYESNGINVMSSKKDIKELTDIHKLLPKISENNFGPDSIAAKYAPSFEELKYNMPDLNDLKKIDEPIFSKARIPLARNQENKSGMVKGLYQNQPKQQ